MERKPIDNLTVSLDRPLLTTFLHELNVARRKLSLYPADHPQIKTSITNTLDILLELFRSNPVITIGIAPETLYFEQLWLDKDDATNREFAKYFFSLGIASISFSHGINGSELIRFNQLLRADRKTIESFGGFDRLLDQQQIEHISIIPIDYDAFQAGESLTDRGPTVKHQLWESFLHGLHNGILDFGDSESTLDLDTVADIFNRKLVGSNAERNEYSRSVSLFIENSIQQQDGPQAQIKNDEKLRLLLEQLTPEAQQEFLDSTLHVLDRHHEVAQTFLEKIPAHLLKKAIAKKSWQSIKISSRLLDLVNNLSGNTSPDFNHNIKSKAEPLSEDMVRARLDVLFSEEKQDLYMPGSYQSALKTILSEDIAGSMPDDEKQKLKDQIEAQSIEEHCLAIIFELLHEQLDSEREESIQRNLLDLSRYFLDTGNFDGLREIYDNWSKYLYSGNTSTTIFDEKVLANHTQLTFMTEVLDGFDLWEQAKHQELVNYISSVGETYSELVIERLALAAALPERKVWMQVLETVTTNAQHKIIQFLGDERWFLVRNLLSVLGKDLNQTSLKAINQLAGHPHPRVRIEVIRILFSCNPATANRQLLKELLNEDPDARMAAIEIADLSRDPAVLNILHKSLETEPLSDEALEHNKQVVRTVARIGNKESIPVLRRILQKQGLLVSRRIKHLQAEIIQSLARFPGATADKLLQELAGGKFRQLAGTALQQRQKGDR